MNKKTLTIIFGLVLALSLTLFVFSAVAAPGVNKLSETTVTNSALDLTLGDYYMGNLSYQQDAIATYNGWQYVAYYNSSRHVSVARRQLPGGSWQSLSLTDYTQSVNDSHNTISLGIAPSDGTIHLAFDHHDDPLHYRRSVTGLANNQSSYSWNASLFGAVTNQLVSGQSVSSVTYPRFVTTPSGNLQLVMRIGSSGSGENHLWEYTNSWTSLGMFIDNPIGGNAYLNGFHYDQNGRLHVSWVKRETPDASTNHDLFYIYSDDNGRTWRNNNGSLIGTTGSDPVTIEEPQVWSIPQSSGLINQEAQTIDHQGRIHVLLRRDSGGTNYQYHYWRESNGTWHETNTGIATKWWARRSKIAVDNNNNVYAITPNLRIGSASASTNWTDWALVNSAEDNRFHSEPLYDWYRLYEGDGVLSVMYQLSNSGSLRVLDFELNASSSEVWTFCADEGEVCSFSGTREVRYGANGFYNYGTFTDGVDCTNSVFGDPINGTVKQCDYLEVDTMPTSTPTNTPVPTSSPTAAPTNTPTAQPGGLIPQTNWSLHYVDSEELSGEDGAATNAFDGSTGTIWHTEWASSSPAHPHEIQINLGASYNVDGFRYLPRQDGNANGRISRYEFYVSTDGSDWGSAVAGGTFANSSTEKEVTFGAKTGQYVRLVALSEVNGNVWTSAAEINVLGSSSGGPTPTPTNTPVGPTNTPTPTNTPVSSSTYQAEDANVGGGATIESNHTGYNGTGFVNFPSSGGYVEYQNVDGGSGGGSTLEFRFALGASSARTGSLIINGSSQNITFQPTGAWNSWSMMNVTVNLNSGTGNTIRLESTGQDLANQDQMTVN